MRRLPRISCLTPIPNLGLGYIPEIATGFWERRNGAFMETVAFAKNSP